jgi:glycerophosphoryl diester phosphodiesterase
VQPWIIAHKGGKEVAPPGSLGAFEDALHSDCDGVELDVRQLGDGTLVVEHDELVDDQPLSGLTAQDFVGLADHPPLLEQVLALVGEKRICNVEIKEPGYEEQVVAFAARSVPVERLLFSSFLDEVVTTLRGLGEDLRTGLIVGRADEPEPSELDLTARIAACGATFVCLRATLIPYGLLDRISSPVLVWTVNDDQLITDLLSDGRVAGIITDCPHRALALRERLTSQQRPG